MWAQAQVMGKFWNWISLVKDRWSNYSLPNHTLPLGWTCGPQNILQIENHGKPERPERLHRHISFDRCWQLFLVSNLACNWLQHLRVEMGHQSICFYKAVQSSDDGTIKKNEKCILSISSCSHRSRETKIGLVLLGFTITSVWNSES